MESKIQKIKQKQEVNSWRILKQDKQNRKWNLRLYKQSQKTPKQNRQAKGHLNKTESKIPEHNSKQQRILKLEPLLRQEVWVQEDSDDTVWDHWGDNRAQWILAGILHSSKGAVRASALNALYPTSDTM